MLKKDKLEEAVKQLQNKVYEKFNKLPLQDREQRIVGYKQALKDIAAKFGLDK